mgnify:CR=1 FL=1
MTPERRAEIRRDYELGRYIPREAIGELLDSETTFGGWRAVIADVNGTGVQLWAQEDLAADWLERHANQLARFAAHLKRHGTGYLIVVHGWPTIHFATLRP